MGGIYQVEVPLVSAIVRHLLGEHQRLVASGEPVPPFACAFQFCTLKRKVRAQLNRVIEDVLHEQGQLKRDAATSITVANRLTLFVGQKIKFDKTMSPVPPPVAKGAKRAKVRPEQRYSAVRNGEIALIISMAEDQGKPVLGIKDPLMPLEAQPIKYILLDPLKHVDPDAISPAWCITINASQGSQFPMMVAWFHPGYDMDRESFTADNVWKREHLYVAASRARYRTIVVSPGGMAALERLVAQCSRPRNTSVKAEIRQHMPVAAFTAVAPTPNLCNPDVEYELMPLSTPCVPTFNPPSSLSKGDDDAEEDDYNGGLFV
jgi:hypothetical protein